MAGVRCFKVGEGPSEVWKGETGSKVYRLVGSNLSQAMGAGILELERTAIPSTIDFDEVCVVLAGQFRSRAGEETFEMGPGDVLWVPAGSTFTLETDSTARIFYARVPFDPNVLGAE